MKIKVSSWEEEQATPEIKQRVHEGFVKFKEALEQDEREARERGSGLPKDWRNRIFKGER